jgi:hypothetical protein
MNTYPHGFMIVREATEQRLARLFARLYGLSRLVCICIGFGRGE